MTNKFDSRIQSYHPFSFSLTSRLLKPSFKSQINFAKLTKTGPLLCPSRLSTGHGSQTHTHMYVHLHSYDKSIGGLNLTEGFLPGLKGSAGEIKEGTRGKLKIVPMEYSLETFQRSNQDTSLTHKPAVFEGNWVQTGDLLTDCASSVGGELSLGQNILVAYMPWEGYNFEDAILISERLVIDDLYTSVHIERYDIETYETKLGLEQITRDIPDVSEKEIEHLDSFGIVKMGAWVEEGDILVGKVTPINKKTISSYQKLLYNILEKEIRSIRDSSLRAPKGIKAKVIDIKYFLRQTGQPLSSESRQAVKNINSKGSTQNKHIQNKPYQSSALEERRVPLGSKAAFAKNTLPARKKGTYKVRESQSFLKKINQTFFRKMSKKEQFSLLRFYFLTRLDFPKSRQFKTQSTKLIEGSHQLSSPVSMDNQLIKPPAGQFRGQVAKPKQKHIYMSGKRREQARVKAYSKLSSYSYISRFLSLLNSPFVSFPSLPKAPLFLPKPTVKDSGAPSAGRKGTNKYKGLIFGGRSQPKLLTADVLQKIETIHIYLAEKRKIQVGDKMAGRHGNKGIVSQILPIQDMPYLPDGTPLDMVLNPLGVPSRMNVGQIYECLLGLAGKFLGENYKVFSFDESYGPEASRSFVFNKLYQARKKTGLKWLFDPNSPGKMCLYDGRTGDCFDQKVTVGQAYMLRLVHMVDDKIHMRSTGPYSLVTQQPLRGRSKQGGQRLGEMEVWAIEGYGAAFTLLEMLTIKSDDMTGRMTLWSNLILNKDISIGTPESFKVLICELQALCLDIGLFRYNEITNQNNIQNKNSLREITSLINLP